MHFCATFSLLSTCIQSIGGGGGGFPPPVPPLLESATGQVKTGRKARKKQSINGHKNVNLCWTPSSQKYASGTQKTKLTTTRINYRNLI